MQWTSFTLVGHSLGGATVAQFAVDHPELLKGLVLLDPADPDRRDSSDAEIEKIVQQRTQARRAQLANGGGGDADALISVASMLATWAKLPSGSGLHFWHGIGHSPNLDCPKEMAAVLRKFVEVTVPARGGQSANVCNDVCVSANSDLRLAASFAASVA